MRGNNRLFAPPTTSLRPGIQEEIAPRQTPTREIPFSRADSQSVRLHVTPPAGRFRNARETRYVLASPSSDDIRCPPSPMASHAFSALQATGESKAVVTNNATRT
ncbi:MAG: hypothetical protein K8U03_20730 [Planctomycetia bacterium]|nr:hypothetical protein [Planctomycetia bacterium]